MLKDSFNGFKVILITILNQRLLDSSGELYSDVVDKYAIDNFSEHSTIERACSAVEHQIVPEGHGLAKSLVDSFTLL